MTAETAPVQRTDVADGPPVVAPVAAGPNSALKEPAPAPDDAVDPRHPAAARLVVADADRAEVRYPDGAEPRRKIAVCGFASSSRHRVPVDDPTWEVWGLNQLYRHIRRADRWFDIHWNWDKETVPGTDYRGWLAGCGIPVYMMARQPDLPTSVTYPLDRMVALAGDYFTSTIAFMVALAVEEVDRAVLARLGRETFETPAHVLERQAALYREYVIGLFGIDLVVDEEYFWQKPCAEFWLGVAVGRGIGVYLPPETALCKQQYRYGYEPEPQTVLRLSELEEHHRKVTKDRDDLLRQIYMHDGALQTDEFWKRLVALRVRGAEVRM